MNYSERTQAPNKPTEGSQVKLRIAESTSRWDGSHQRRKVAGRTVSSELRVSPFCAVNPGMGGKFHIHFRPCRAVERKPTVPGDRGWQSYKRQFKTLPGVPASCLAAETTPETSFLPSRATPT